MKADEVRKISKQLRMKASEMKASPYSSDHRILVDAADAIDKLLDVVLDLALTTPSQNNWSKIPPAYPNPYKQ